MNLKINKNYFLKTNLVAFFLLTIFITSNQEAFAFDLTELKAYYTFDETSGDLINEATNAGSTVSLGASADGQVESGITREVSGLIGNSYRFPGSASGQVTLGSSTSQFNFMHNQTAKWSVNYWTNSTTSTSGAILQNDVGTTGNVGIDINQAGTVNGRVSAGVFRGVIFTSVIGPANAPAGSLPHNGQWHMVTITYDYLASPPNMKQYVDGSLVHTEVNDGAIPSNSNAAVAMQLGGFGDLVPYTGDLDEMSIWNRVLSDSEVLELYNSGAGLDLGETPIPPATNFQLSLDNVNAEIDLSWDSVPSATEYIVQRLSTENSVVKQSNLFGDNNFVQNVGGNNALGDDTGFSAGEIPVEVKLRTTRLSGAAGQGTLNTGLWWNVITGTGNGVRQPNAIGENEQAGIMISGGSRLSRDCNSGIDLVSKVPQDGYTQRADGTWFDGDCQVPERFLGTQIHNLTSADVADTEVMAVLSDGSSAKVTQQGIATSWRFSAIDLVTGTWFVNSNYIETEVSILDQTAWENVTTTSSTSYSDPVTRYNTYFYRIIPKNTSDEGIPSNILNGTLSIIPERVADLNATDNGSTVDLVWTEAPIRLSRQNSNDPVQGYIIQRATGANETVVYDGLSHDVEEYFLKNDGTLVKCETFCGQGVGTGVAPSYGSDISIGGQILNITQSVNITRMVVKVGMSSGTNFNTDPDLGGAIYFSNGTLVSRSILPRVSTGGDIDKWGSTFSEKENFVNWAFSPPVHLEPGEYVFGWSSLNHQTCNSNGCGLGNADVGDFEYFFETTNNGDSDGYAIGDIQLGVGGKGFSKVPLNNTKDKDYAMAIYAEPTWTTIGTTVGATSTTFTDTSPPTGVTKAYRVLPFNDAGIGDAPALLHNPEGTILGHNGGNVTEYFPLDAQGRNRAGGLNTGEIVTFVEPTTPSQSTLKITKLTTGGDDTFDFTVSGPTSYNPSINTAGGGGGSIEPLYQVLYAPFEGMTNASTTAPNLGTLGANADGQYYESDIATNFNIVSGKIGDAAYQEGTSSLEDQGEIRFGSDANKSQWNFLHTLSGSNLTSINFWIKGDVVGGPEYPILQTADIGSTGISTASDYFYLYTQNGATRLKIKENSLNILPFNSVGIGEPPDDGQWHMVTILINKANTTAGLDLVTAYLDNVRGNSIDDAANPFTGSGGTANSTLTVGNQRGESATTENSFAIDDLTIWNGYQLTESDINTLWNSGDGSSAGGSGGGMGMDGPTTVDPGTYSITETIPSGWILTDASCNDGFSTFVVDTVSGIVIGPSDNIECTFEDLFNPTPQCNGLDATIIGTAGNDTLDGTSGDDVIVGLDGNDTIDGKGGNDTICGGDGDDIISGNGGSDTIFGDAGNDELFGNDGTDEIHGGTGIDYIEGGLGADTIFGDDGNDVIFGKDGADTIDGGSGGDLISGDAGADIITGGDGNDRILGGGDGDTISGNAGDDVLLGEAGGDTLDGGTNEPSGVDVCIGGGQGGDSNVNCEIVI